MAHQNEKYEIDKGPSKLDIMLALFDTYMGVRTLQFLIGSVYKTDPTRKTEWLGIQIISARRHNATATIWEIEGIVNLPNNRKRVSIYYLSDMREGFMRFEDELHTAAWWERPAKRTPYNDARRAGALMKILERMFKIARDRYGDSMGGDFFALMEKAKLVHRAEDSDALNAAIENI